MQLSNNLYNLKVVPTVQNDFSNRVLAIDLARGIAVILMVLVHCLWMYGDIETQSNSTFGWIVHTLGKGTAAFVMAMGFSLMLSRRQSSKDWFIRGIFLVLAGFGLNILKFIVPIVAGTMPESFIQAYGWESPLAIDKFIYLVSTGDILQFAGVSLMVLALIKAFIVHPIGYLALALLCAFIAKPLSGWQPENEWLHYSAKLFFSNDWQVYFPVFPWISLILIGMYFGDVFVKTKSQQQTFKQMALMGVFLFALGGGLMIQDFEYHFNNFFHIGAGGILYLAGLNMVAYWGVYKLIQLVLNKSYGDRFVRQITFLSRNVTVIYVIQWTLVCWGMSIIGYQTLDSGKVLIAYVGVLMMTLFITALYESIKKGRG